MEIAIIGILVVQVFFGIILMMTMKRVSELDAHFERRDHNTMSMYSSLKELVNELRNINNQTVKRVNKLGEFVGAEFVDDKTSVNHKEAHYKKIEKKK